MSSEREHEMMIKSYRDLDVWKLAMDFVEQVYVLTRKFPKIISIMCQLPAGHLLRRRRRPQSRFD